MNVTSQHRSRVKTELKQAGATWYGLHKLESSYLPQLIHPEEHIAALVYGQYAGGSGMLVATDRRVIFLDHKPGYTFTDELTYDMVSGIGRSLSGPFTTLVLHTRLGDYKIRYASGRAGRKFVDYIEKRRLETFKVIVTDMQTTPLRPSQIPTLVADDPTVISPEGLTFLKEHDIAVLSTVDKTSQPHGAVVYYIIDDENLLYVVTKSQTRKSLNILSNTHVALTCYDTGRYQTMQLQGTAQIETDTKKKDFAFDQIIRRRLTAPGAKTPAVMRIEEGSFVIIRITPTNAHFRDYSQ